MEGIMEESVKINYTIINHTARIKLGLTANEYIIADLIYNLSNNPSHTGWCYASKKTLGEMVGITEQSVHTILNKLAMKELIQKHPETRHLKATPSWYNCVIIKDTKESLAILKKVEPYTKESLADDTKETSVHSIYKDNIYKDNYKDKEIIVFLNKFNDLFGTTYKPTSGRQDKLKQRMKNYPIENILQACEALSRSKFHTGSNDRGWKADPDFLLRNDEQIDKWLNEYTPRRKRESLADLISNEQTI